MENKETKYREIIRANLDNTLSSGFVPELGKHRQGKVRDIHLKKEEIEQPLVMVASDRVSSFDYVLDRCIPFKGRVLNLLSNWAQAQTTDIVPNAMVASPYPNVMVQKYYKNIMVECVVRGYVWGSLAGEYEKGQRDFYGDKLEDGFLRYQKFDEPFFTPTTKADEHDAPMTFTEVEDFIGKKLAKKVKEISIALYKRGAEIAEKQGLLFIDTKYEFGLDKKGELYLIDEANTPDSSRYCDVEEYKKFEAIKNEMGSGKHDNVSALLKERPELKIKELSKQFVRDVLVKNGFSYGSTGAPPSLSDGDVIEVSYRYISLYERLTGEDFEFPAGEVREALLSGLRKEGYIKGGQAVIMAGSDSDMPHLEKLMEALGKYGIPAKIRICSAHKQASTCEKLLGQYNSSLEPVVILAVAGGTDALSGLASFHSVHPVVSCPPDRDNYLSCVENPPGSSNSLVRRVDNAARHVAQILGFSVPEARKTLLDANQKKIAKLEEADSGL